MPYCCLGVRNGSSSVTPQQSLQSHTAERRQRCNACMRCQTTQDALGLEWRRSGSERGVLYACRSCWFVVQSILIADAKQGKKKRLVVTDKMKWETLWCVAYLHCTSAVVPPGTRGRASLIGGGVGAAVLACATDASQEEGEREDAVQRGHAHRAEGGRCVHTVACDGCAVLLRSSWVC